MVVTVEPYYENIIRIHKAARLQSLQNRIVLIQNAVFDKRHIILSLKSDAEPDNQVIKDESERFTRNDLSNNKLLVETIWMDDLVGYLPKTHEGKDFQKAIIKMDIEGSETLAFAHARKLLTRLDVVTIFMEWGFVAKKDELRKSIIDFIDLLNEFGYIALGEGENNQILSLDDWKNWPGNIKWVKKVKISK